MTFDKAFAILSALGGIAIVIGAMDARRKMRERNRAIEASWHAHKKEELNDK